MPITYIMILIIIAIFLLFFLYIEPMIAKNKIKNNNEHGSARFANFKEIKRDFKKESISNINKAGFPIWYSKDYKTIWFDRETPHYVYLGSTGSGKSVTAVIPTCSFIANAKEERSVFITDPKGEIFNKTSKMFKDKGYKIITIDFRHPELSNKFNILQPIINEYKQYMKYDNEKTNFEKKIDELNNLNIELNNKINTPRTRKIKKESYTKEIENNNNLIDEYKNKIFSLNNLALSHYAETNRLITSLSQMITQEKVQQKDPFWNNSARQLLEGLIGFFLEEFKLGNIKEEQITMTSIRKFQNSSMGDENSKKFKSYIETKPYGTKSKDSLTSILSASENTLKSITAVFGEKMALFDDINVANVTSESNFEFDCLGKEKTALYVIVPDEDKTYFTLVTIIVGLLYKELVKLANSRKEKRLKVQIDWLLDEFANCPPLADIEAMVSVARSRGMRFQFFIQSFAQLDNVYGKDVAQIILDNCGLVYLKTNTQETAEAISKRLGKKTIESSSISQSISLMDYNGNKSTSLMARDLLTPDEVKQLHYKTIIFPITGYPIFRDTVMYNKFSCYKDGEIEREKHNLKDLTNTYFTVEDIKHEYKTSRGRMRDRNRQNDENEEFFKELAEMQKIKFESFIKILDELFSKNVYELEYKIINNQLYIDIKFIDVPNGKLMTLKGKIPRDKYVVYLDLQNKKLEVHSKLL